MRLQNTTSSTIQLSDIPGAISGLGGLIIQPNGGEAVVFHEDAEKSLELKAFLDDGSIIVTNALEEPSTGTSIADPTTEAVITIDDDRGQPNGIATLDAGGKVPKTQIPQIAITDVFTAADETAMLALPAEQGDIACRTDDGTVYILSLDPATVLANWKLMSSVLIGDFNDGGDAAGADRNLGNTNAFALNFITNGATRIHLAPAGAVVIGSETAISGAILTVDGILNATSYRIGSNTVIAGDGTITPPAGTALAPGLAHQGDPDTGMFSPAANTMGWAVNGAEAMRIEPTKRLILEGDMQIKGGSPGVTKVLTSDAQGLASWQLTAPDATKLPLAGGTMTGAMQGAAGTPALPGVALAGDPDTGVYSPGANQWAVATGGVLRFQIDASGMIVVVGQIKIQGGSPGAGKILTSDANGVGTWNTLNDATKLPLAGGTMTGALTYNVGTPGVGKVMTSDASGLASWQDNIHDGGVLVGDSPAWTGLHSFLAGAVGAPTISFAGDPNTGVYSPGPDQWAVTTAGVTRITVSAAGVVGPGQFKSSNNLGSTPNFQCSNGLKCGIGGDGTTLKLFAGNVIWATATANNFDIGRATSVPLGVVSTVGLGFTSDPNTGIYSPGPDQWAVATNGTLALSIDASQQATFSSRVLAGTGSFPNPEFSFSADPDTGIHRVGANTMAMIAGGNNVFQIQNDYQIICSSLTKIKMGSGTASTPGYTFASSPNAGMYRVANNHIGFSTGSTLRIDINPSGTVTFANQVKINGGTPALGKVLTSDASGLATWETPSGGVDGVYNHSSSLTTGLFVSAFNAWDLKVLNSIKMSADASGVRMVTSFKVLSTGSLSAPGMRGSSDGNTGINIPGSDTLNLVTGGVNRILINASGQVDIPGVIKIQGGTPALGKVLTSDANGLASWTDTSNWVAAPAATGSTGTAGQKAFDSGFIYICTATDTWKRVAIAAW